MALLTISELRERAQFLEGSLPIEGDQLENPLRFKVFRSDQHLATKDVDAAAVYDQMLLTGIQYNDTEKIQRIAVTTDDGKIYTFDRSVRTFVLDAILIDKVDRPEIGSRNQVELFRHIYENFLRLSQVTKNRYTVAFEWVGGNWSVALTGFGMGDTSRSPLAVAVSIQGFVFRELDGGDDYIPRMDFGVLGVLGGEVAGLLSKESAERLGVTPTGILSAEAEQFDRFGRSRFGPVQI